ncbi:MAG: hypothetical protein GKR98_07610 [Boseongicola sp.]|nr:MAG: hypothetical protein GKR98_07610 [Boseongicola sp.]
MGWTVEDFIIAAFLAACLTPVVSWFWGLFTTKTGMGPGDEVDEASGKVAPVKRSSRRSQVSRQPFSQEINQQVHRGVRHVVPQDVKEFVVPNFRPTVDTCDVVLHANVVGHVRWRPDNGVILTLSDDMGTLEICFLGLDDLPADDILIRLKTSAVPGVAHPLSALVPVSEIRHSDEANLDRAWAASDAKEQVAKMKGPVTWDQNHVAVFEEFDASTETVEILVPRKDTDGKNLEVHPTPDGRHGLVIVAGRTVAVLGNAPDATAENVHIIVQNVEVAA